MTEELPLFPLNTVLFPGGVLPLRVFEPRYRRLVDICGHDKPFVIARIRAGREVGEPAFCWDIGTIARIGRVQAQQDGSLAVVVTGQSRVRLQSPRVEDDGLMFAPVERLLADTTEPVPDNLLMLATALKREGMLIDDAAALAWRLAEILPLDPDFRQHLLEENVVLTRVNRLRDWLDKNQGTLTA
jgi:Lon protease-like protein